MGGKLEEKVKLISFHLTKKSSPLKKPIFHSSNNQLSNKKDRKIGKSIFKEIVFHLTKYCRSIDSCPNSNPMVTNTTRLIHQPKNPNPRTLFQSREKQNPTLFPLHIYTQTPPILPPSFPVPTSKFSLFTHSRTPTSIPISTLHHGRTTPTPRHHACPY